MATSSRLENEIAHGKKLLEEGAEKTWNWDSASGRVRADKRARLLAKYGKISKTDKVLEIGCGTGLFTEKIYKLSGASITAIDISEDLLNEARKRLPEAEFVLGDAMNLAYPDSSFDVVFGSSVLHHLDMKKAYQELFRVLKPGGRFVFAEPNMINPQILIQKNIPFIKRMLGDSPDETAINRWKAKKALQDAGFSKVNIFPYDFLHPATPGFMIGLVEFIGRIVEKTPILKEIAGSVIMSAEKAK